jgi:predicted DNA-binding transcriptional regulator YafY
VLGFGADARVLEPAALREAVAADLARAAAQYRR